jgi:hypothetical protein
VKAPDAGSGSARVTPGGVRRPALSGAASQSLWRIAIPIIALALIAGAFVAIDSQGWVSGYVLSQSSLVRSLSGAWTTMNPETTVYRFREDGTYSRQGVVTRTGSYRLVGINQLSMTDDGSSEVDVVSISFPRDADVRFMYWDAGTPGEVVLMFSGL